MGLREKVALAMVAVITAQIVCSHCMPRGLPKCSVKSHINSLISPKSDRIREFKTNKKLKKNSFNNIITGNSSKPVLYCPNLENPTDSKSGGYYCFHNDYPKQTKTFSKTRPQIRNFKREAKQKRNFDITPNDKANLTFRATDVAYDPPPQPYCFRKSNFFPEVDYPLSARDMWIPNYWSRLLDAEVPRDFKTDPPVLCNPIENTKSIYSTYEKSPLYSIIKTLNTNKRSDPYGTDPNIDFKVPIPNLTTTTTTLKPFINTTLILTPSFETTTTTTVFLESTSPPDMHSEFNVMPSTPTVTEAYPLLVTTKSSTVAPSVTSAITTSTGNENLSTPPYTTTSMIPKIPVTTSSVTNSELSYPNFDGIDVTTVSPFDQFTSPMTPSEVPTENFVSLTQMTKMPSTISTTITPVEGQERELHPFKTKTRTTTTSPLLSLHSRNKAGQELRNYTTPMALATMSKTYLDDKVPTTDSNSLSGDYLDFSHSCNLTHGNMNSPNDTLVTSNMPQEVSIDNNTKETVLKQEVMKNVAEINFIQPKNNRSIFRENPIQLDELQSTGISNYSQSSLNDDILLLCTKDNSNSSIHINNFNETWVFSPNDSYITWESPPEYPDDSIIFVDAKNTSSSQVIATDNDVNVSTNKDVSLLPRNNCNLNQPELDVVANNETSIPTVPDQTVVTENTKAQESPKISLNKIPKSNVTNSTRNITKFDTVVETQPMLNYLMQESNINENILTNWNNTVSDPIVYIRDMNSTSQNEYADDTWASYTEIPYDSLVLYPEFVNNTWFSGFNNSYVIYQQTPDDSDDATLHFLDTEKTAELFNDIILNTN